MDERIKYIKDELADQKEKLKFHKEQIEHHKEYINYHKNEIKYNENWIKFHQKDGIEKHKKQIAFLEKKLNELKK